MKKNFLMFLLITISAPLFSRPHTSQRDSAFWRLRLRSLQGPKYFSKKSDRSAECTNLRGMPARQAITWWSNR